MSNKILSDTPCENNNCNNNDYILEVDGLKKYFPIETNFFGKPKRYLKAVDNVSFKVKRGTALGIVGESGCGKTTLGRTILRLYDVDGGSVKFKGDDITGLKKNKLIKYRTAFQFIFQDPYSSLPPRMTVGSIIGEAVKVHKIVPKNEIVDYVKEIMRECGLKPSWYDRYPHEFSGGQRQRICIARALAVKPELVICDEPVSALDVSIQAQIINLLKKLQNEKGLTYLFISHDLSVVKYITDNILVMYLGNVMEKGSTSDIFRNPLHPYTQALFSAVPVPDPDSKMKRIILSGDIPSPANPPKGCKFHTRCANCMKICSEAEPEYREIESEHFVACHLYDDKEGRNPDDYLPYKPEDNKEVVDNAEEKAINEPISSLTALSGENKEVCCDNTDKEKAISEPISPLSALSEENKEVVDDTEENAISETISLLSACSDEAKEKAYEQLKELSEKLDKLLDRFDDNK